MKNKLLIVCMCMHMHNAFAFSLAKHTRKMRNYFSTIAHDKYDALQEWADQNAHIIDNAILSCIIGGGTYWLWALSRKANPFKLIMVSDDKRPVRGMQAEYNNSRIIQLEVKSQFDFDAAGRGSCGYHAINNGERIVGYLTGRFQNLIRALFNIDKIQERFGSQGRWRKKIKNGRRDNSQGEWLNGREIDRLMQRNTKIPRHNYDVVDDIQLLGLRVEPVYAGRSTEDEAQVDPIIPHVKRALAQALEQGRDYIHQFFINTARHFQAGQQGNVGGSDGHWFTVVLHQLPSGQQTYFIAESLDNKNRLNDYHVRKLIDAIRN